VSVSGAVQTRLRLSRGPRGRLGGSMFALRVGFFLTASVLLFAQDPRGSIAGRVVDKSDAVLVGAKVQAVNVQTGVTAVATSNETGTFRVPFLVPGTYRLTVETKGV